MMSTIVNNIIFFGIFLIPGKYLMSLEHVAYELYDTEYLSWLHSIEHTRYSPRPNSSRSSHFFMRVCASPCVLPPVTSRSARKRHTRNPLADPRC